MASPRAARHPSGAVDDRSAHHRGCRTALTSTSSRGLRPAHLAVVARVDHPLSARSLGVERGHDSPTAAVPPPRPINRDIGAVRGAASRGIASASIVSLSESWITHTEQTRRTGRFLRANGVTSCGATRRVGTSRTPLDRGPLRVPRSCGPGKTDEQERASLGAGRLNVRSSHRCTPCQ